MPESYKISLLTTLGLIFFIPLFFIPGGAIPYASAKSLLFTIGLMILTLSFLYESYKQGSIALSKHYLLWAALLLPVIYLLSALLSTPSSLSLLGYSLEVGTFGFMVVGVSALIITSIIFATVKRSLQALAVLFASLTILALWTVVKVLSGGEWLILGNFTGNMGNPLGSWTDLGLAFALLSIFVILAIGMIPMKVSFKAFLYAMFVVSTVLLAVIGFSTAMIIALIASVFLYFYFEKVEREFYFSPKGEMGEKREESKINFFSKQSFLPLVLGIVSLAFLINPTVSEEKKLGTVVSDKFGIENVEVRPTLSTTLNISKAVLSQVALLGSGPNTFANDWLIFKPVDINTTPFWEVSFPFGAGFIPTQIATTGILGSALWLAFFVSLLVLAITAMGRIPESRSLRFSLISTLLITLSIWIGSFLYSPSAAMILIGFIFTGLFIALCKETGAASQYELKMKETSPMRFVSVIIIAAVAFGSVSLGWIGAKKAIAAYHFQHAFSIANTEGTSVQAIETELGKAIRFSPVDIHYRALSRLNFSKAQAAANAATGTPETNRAIFEESLRVSIQAARAAIAANPAGYENWVALGTIYAALVPEPLKLEGAYENAKFAYTEAAKRNPNNPHLFLLLADLESNNSNADAARSYLYNAIALKEDYAEAYLLLARLEMREKNIPEAIASAEVLVALNPNNAGLHFELGLLKQSQGNIEGARASLARALELAPESEEIKVALQSLDNKPSSTSR